MMNVSALSTPHTPPFDFASFQNNNTAANNKSNNNTTFYHLNDNKVEFRRDSSVMPSPPELMLDSEEDEESVASSSSHSRSSYMSELYHMRRNHNSGRKSAPHRSPSIENHTPFDNSIVFQLDVNSNLNCKSRIINQHYDNHPYHQPLHRINRENQYTIKPVRIQLPKIQHHIVKNNHSVPSWQKKILNDVPEEPVLEIKKPIHHQRKSSTNNNVGRRRSSSNNNSNNVVTTTAPNGTLVVKHASSGRPSRVKGPCQACQETSDGCMRKAFNWPFPTGSQYNDKGKPFVYLCNKCGLR
jgi:hypothetical protein